MNTPTRNTAGSGDIGPPLAAQHIVAEARQLLNRIEFDAACGATLQGDLSFVSVMPTSDDQKAGCFGIVVVCRPRSRQPVDWSTLRVYASPKAGESFGSLGPLLDRFGQACINNLAQGDYALRAYHRLGEDALRVQQPLRDKPTESIQFVTRRRISLDDSATDEGWTSLPPQPSAVDGITLHRSVSGHKVRIEFFSEDSALVGAQIEFCLVLRDTEKQLIKETARLKSVENKDGCTTEPLEMTVPAEMDLDIHYRFVTPEDAGQDWDEGGLAKLFAGAATKVRVAVDSARGWIDQLITSAEFTVASPMPSTRRLDRSTAGPDAPTEAAGWILQRIDSEEGSKSVMLVATTSEHPDDPEPVQVRVLAWPQEVIERVRDASGEVELKTGDVYRLFDEWVEHSGEFLIEVAIPAGFRSKPLLSAARIPVGENGVLQIVLELVADA